VSQSQNQFPTRVVVLKS